MHSNSSFRDPVLEAFDNGYPSPSDVVDRLGGPAAARVAFGRLWNSSDILPGDIINLIMDWDDVTDLRRRTFAGLSQWMFRHVL